MKAKHGPCVTIVNKTKVHALKPTEAAMTCEHYVTVGVVSCEGFLLWRVPHAPSCGSGDCTANASGL